MIGTIGKLLILVAIVATAVSCFSFYRSTNSDIQAGGWKKIGRAAWIVMSLATLAAFGLLMYLGITHQFQYAYVYENTSLDLPLKYLISATWAGQEGSFLLWTLLNGFVGLAVIRLTRDFEAPVMAVIGLCQVFLISMIVGLDLGVFELGASPFATLIERFPDTPMIQAGIIPVNGQGLNDLLQNYWMVIHPPVLFAGFASMIVPFAFAVSALWKKRYTDWVRPALPWALFGVLSLGVGIALGGYWAYVTLSFGGYWAWDPVENSSLVPWIVGIAAVHTMIVQKRSGHAQKASLLLSVLAYLLVIYSTFLTRSGILADVSVHSFVDLHLYNQLLLWILVMGGIGIGLFFSRMKELPTPKDEPELLSREFMLFAGAMLFTAVGAVVLLGTSAPIMGRLFRDSPSTVPIMFYNKWSLPLMIVMVFLAGLGQLFWWNRMTIDSINRVLLKPIIFSVVSTTAVLIFTPFTERSEALSVAANDAVTGLKQAGLMDGVSTFWNAHAFGILLLLLTFVAFFALYGNGMVMWRVARGNLRMAGGALTHIGFAILILGIIASSGFSAPIVRDTGVRIGQSRDNFIVALGETRAINGYTVTYTGHGVNDEDHPTYELAISDPQGRSFTVSPVVYESNKGQWIQNPDVKTFLEKDLFVAVTPNVMFTEPDEESEGEISITRGDSIMLGEDHFSLEFLDFDMNAGEHLQTDSAEVSVGARLRITDLVSKESREIVPVYMILKDRTTRSEPQTIEDWDLSVAFTGMNVDNGAITLVVAGVQTAPEDWLVVQAYEKPLISLVWIGIILLSIGFIIAMIRRSIDVRIANRRATAAG